MKKILLAICFVIGSLSVFAQTTISIKGGVNFSGQTMTGETGLSRSSSTLTTFSAGIVSDFKHGNVSIQPALLFTGKGADYTYDLYNDLGGKTGTATVSEKLYYLELPVNVVYHVSIVVGDIYFGAGPYVAEGLIGEEDVPAAITGTGDKNSSLHFGSAYGDITPTQFGADAIAGIKFTNHLLVNFNYDLGLTNDNPPTDAVKAKSHVFGISIGYTF